MTTSLAEYYRGAEAAAAALATAGSIATERARRVHAALEPLLAGDAAQPRACRDGCAHCCHFPVGVTFAEACLLADTVAGDTDLSAGVLAAAEATATRTWPALVGTPCPLLRPDGRCSTYLARPLPCRALASSDAAACGAALLGPTAVPREETAFWRGLGAAATLGASPPGGARELRSAVAALLIADATARDRATAFAAARGLP